MERGRSRSRLPLLLWAGSLAAGLVLFHGIGAGPLAAPPRDPGGWSAWLAERDGVVATVALLRLVVLAVTWYLVGATAVGLLARSARSVRAVRLADALTVPALRRLLQASVGLSLATGVVMSAIPAGVAVASEPRTVAAGELDASHDGVPEHRGAAARSPSRVHDGHPALRLLGQGSVQGGGMEPAVVEASFGSEAAPTPPPLRRLDVVAGGNDSGVDGRARESAPADVVASSTDGSVKVPAGRGPVPDASSRRTTSARRTATGEHEVVLRHLGPGRGDDAGASGRIGSGVIPEDGSSGGQSPAGMSTEHVVVAGESLWTIARDVVAGELGRTPTDAEVAGYWLDLIEMQRPFLANPDDPDLIFPGERVRLPATAERWRG